MQDCLKYYPESSKTHLKYGIVLFYEENLTAA